MMGFEWEDQPWFPHFLRQYMMDFLRFVLNTGNLYQPVTAVLWQGLQQTGRRHITDLCSGGGGAIPAIQKNLRKQSGQTISFTLTDLYPNAELTRQWQEEAGNTLSYYSLPVNATDVPPVLPGFRTMFSAFHHFDEVTAKEVLQNAADAGEGIAVFDGGNRSVWFILLILIFQPIAFLVFTPFIKPFSIGRLLFTYLLPVVPFCTMWDGVMSVLRLYTPAEMLQLTSGIQTEYKYEWKSGKIRNAIGMSIGYLIGYPL